VHALLLSGGSAFGLDAAAGVMSYLEASGVGFRVREAVVPIVPAAIIFDLSVGNPRARPRPPWRSRPAGPHRAARSRRETSARGPAPASASCSASTGP